MTSEEIEVGYGGAIIKARGLLAIKAVFVGVMSVLFLYVVLPVVRLEVVTAAAVYLLGVIAFVVVFFGSWRLTFRVQRKRRPKAQKKEVMGPKLDEYTK